MGAIPRLQSKKNTFGGIYRGRGVLIQSNFGNVLACSTFSFEPHVNSARTFGTAVYPCEAPVSPQGPPAFQRLRLRRRLGRGRFYVWANKKGTVTDRVGRLCLAGNSEPAWSREGGSRLQSTRPSNPEQDANFSTPQEARKKSLRCWSVGSLFQVGTLRGNCPSV